MYDRKKLLKDFVNYFQTGYQFEKFTKILLIKLGFDDVKVTKKSGDKGIDLVCIKEEIDGMDINPSRYIVQAKRYSENNKVSAKEIREFKGTSSSDKRIFITTSSFTKFAEEEAKDLTNSVILINGEMLISYCVNLDNFVFDLVPTFSKQRMDDLFANNNDEDKIEKLDQIEKSITKNDVRARILRIPTEIYERIKNKNNYQVKINGEDKILNISRDGRYFGGVTKYYKELGFLANENFIQAKSIWEHDFENRTLIITIK